MQFIDTVRLHPRGGRGGDGCVGFRREKFIEKGGPNGGSGGRGGSVWLEADENLSTLLDLAVQPHPRAPDGYPGKGWDKTGAEGEDRTVRVPCGTIVIRDGRVLADMTEPGERVLIAKGGRGGRGNAAFKTHTNTAPRIREKGEPGEEPEVDLELKLLADVGLVGFPNAGKSTLLAAVSAARPKVADYPFTTLSPHLGVVAHKGRSFVMADLPGLIEGAKDGKGLGDEFLRHVERTRVLVHLVDPAGFDGVDPLAGVKVIEKELVGYSPALTKKPRVLVVTKTDLPEAEAVLRKVRARWRTKTVFAICAPARKGLSALLDRVVREVSRAPEEAPTVLSPVYTGPKLSVVKERGAFVIRGTDVERHARMSDFSYFESARRFQGILKKMGVWRRLIKLGIKVGDSVRVGEYEMEWADEKRPPQQPARRRKDYRKRPQAPSED